MNLKQELNALESIKNPHRRGVMFETFLAKVLEEESFSVSSNPKIAKPRQTDLYAERDHLSFLIEAKWWRTPIHSGHISGVRERLRLCPANVFACVFSMSGYADNAVDETTRDRRLEILLFDDEEIRAIASAEVSFNDLLSEKRRRLRKNATMWFKTQPKNEPNRLRYRSSLPALRLGNENPKWVFCSNKGDDVIFSKEMLDLGTYGDTSVCLRIPVDLETCDDLDRFLRALKKQVGLAGNDSFAIHQRSAGWYGFGADNFLEAIEKWEKRYEELNWDSYHHSEELAFVDHVECGGLVCLTSRQRVGTQAYLHSSYLEVLISGVPVDLSGLGRLCNSTQNLGARLEINTEKAVEVHRFHPRIPVEAIGKVITTQDGEDYVSGLVVKNPFYGRPLPFTKHRTSSAPLGFLSNNEALVCAMPQWHSVDALKYKYDLVTVEGCWAENIPVLYVRCDWR